MPKLEDKTLLTTNQQTVLAVLEQADKPMTAYAILASDPARDAGMKAPPTIYRALERLVELGLAHRIESLNAYSACDHSHEQHAAAFAICDRCGSAEELKLEACQQHLHDDASKRGFTVQDTQVELHGICAACATD